MSQQTPAYVISAASHSAALFRQAFGAPLMRQGAFGKGEYRVTQQGSPNMSVQVAAGRCSIQGTQVSPPAGFPWSAQGSYFGLNDGTATVTIAASNPSNPRIDTVYVAVQDAFYAGAANQAVLTVATGTPSSSPVAPTLPANAFAVANVAVAAGATSIVNANITQLADVDTNYACAVGGIDAVPAGVYPTTPYIGQYVDDASLGLMRWDGTAWRQYAASAARRVDGYASITVGTAQLPLTAWTNQTYSVGNIGYASGVYTVATPGVYRWSLTVQWPAAAGGYRVLQFVSINGATTDANGEMNAWFVAGSAALTITAGGEIQLAANGTVQGVLQGSTGGIASTVPIAFTLSRVA